LMETKKNFKKNWREDIENVYRAKSKKNKKRIGTNEGISKKYQREIYTYTRDSTPHCDNGRDITKEVDHLQVSFTVQRVLVK
jgi:hypothetical protein